MGLTRLVSLLSVASAVPVPELASTQPPKDAAWAAAHPKRGHEAAEWAKAHPKLAKEPKHALVPEKDSRLHPPKDAAWAMAHPKRLDEAEDWAKAHPKLAKQSDASVAMAAKVCPKYVSLTGNRVDAKSKFKNQQVDDEYCDKNCKAGFCPEDKCRCISDKAPKKPADADAAPPLVAPKVPKVATDACPRYLSLTDKVDVKSKFKNQQVDNEWCEKNCRGNFLSCPKDKCRCSTEAPPKPEDPSSVPPLQRMSKKPECLRYVSIKLPIDDKSKFKHMQVDDGYCDSNCKRGFCPKESCKCTDEPLPSLPGFDANGKPKEVVPRTMTPTEARAAEAVKERDEQLAKAADSDSNGAEAAAAERDALTKERDEALAKAEAERMEKSEADRREAEAARVAAVPDAVAAVPDDVGAVPEFSPLVAPTALPVVPMVAPTPFPFTPPGGAAVIPEETAAKDDCPSYVAINPPKGENKGAFKQVDDAYCEKNCKAGFCPKESCKCSTDPDPDPIDSADLPAAPEVPDTSPLVAPTAPDAVPVAPPVADEQQSALKDGCPSYVANNPPDGENKGAFKQVDDAYCEKNCKAGFCPIEQCRCSTEPAPEKPAGAEEDDATVANRDWRKNLRRNRPQAPAQPTPWWKKSSSWGKPGAKADDAEQEYQLSHLLPKDEKEENWKDSAEVYQEGATEVPSL